MEKIDLASKICLRFSYALSLLIGAWKVPDAAVQYSSNIQVASENNLKANQNNNVTCTQILKSAVNKSITDDKFAKDFIDSLPVDVYASFGTALTKEQFKKELSKKETAEERERFFKQELDKLYIGNSKMQFPIQQ
jgi:hypothetical protein